jgi:hypothetical protein
MMISLLLKKYLGMNHVRAEAGRSIKPAVVKVDQKKGCLHLEKKSGFISPKTFFTF